MNYGFSLAREGKNMQQQKKLRPEYGTQLFPGFQVKQAMLFNVIRDADFAVDEVIRHNKRTEGQATKGAW